MELKNFTHQKCQEVAEEFLNHHGFIKKGKVPVSVEILAERAGVRFHVIPGLQRRFGIKGLAVKKMPAKQYEIILDEWHYDNEEQSAPFTIAEELGHILIHSELFDAINSVEGRLKFEQELDTQNHQLFEMQAKRVASNLLLPSSLFNDYVYKWCDGCIEEIRKDNPMNERDLGYFISTKLQPRLNLSQMIIERALTRWTPTPLTTDIVKRYDIKLLENTPPNKITEE